MFPAFCGMHLVFFFGDFAALLNRRTEGAAMHGAGASQRSIVMLLKVAHLGLLLVCVPLGALVGDGDADGAAALRTALGGLPQRTGAGTKF